MNLAEALNAAVPEIVRPPKSRYPRLDPALVVREQVEGGEPMMMIYKRENGNLYRLYPILWEVVQHFDGVTSYEEVAEAIANTWPVSAEELKQFCDGLGEVDFWYKSPQEKNAALHHLHQEERRKHVKKKSKYGDVSHMQFSAWDPDVFLTKWYNAVSFIYTRWFTAFTLTMFTIMAVIFVLNWGEIGRDTLKYYTFTEKSAGELLEFWLLFFVLGFFHESAHGLSCKHFGAEVHSMGFHLIYLTPAFFIDLSEVYVFGGRWQRFICMLSGIWVEMMFCSVATLVWWGTPPGVYAHELAYKVMLITGVAVIVVNANPLIKLDGYYMFSEIVQTPELKDRATAFISTWLRNKVFRLPVEIEWVPRKRIWLYTVYGVLSGAYSYMLLFAVSRFAYNVFSRYSPEYGVIPGVGIFLLIFKGRIKTFFRFVKTVYMDKREWIKSKLTPSTMAAAAVTAAVVLFVPIWPDRIEARCSLEPSQHAELRAVVPGFVTEMRVREGQAVRQGEVLAVLHNAEIESLASKATADRQAAQMQFARAQMSYASLGSASAAQDEMVTRERLARQEREVLNVKAPFDGIVTTPNPQDEVGAYRDRGDSILNIAGTGQTLARAYVAEFDLRNLQIGQHGHVFVDELGRSRSGEVMQVAEEAVPMAPGLLHMIDYKGLEPPKYYVATIALDRPLEIRDQSTGTVKIDVGRISAAHILYRQAHDFFGRKLW